MNSFELARDDFRMKQPPNYGLMQYHRLKQREEEEKVESLRPPKPRIFDELERQPVVSSTLDGTGALQRLNEEEQCEFFSRYPKCRSLVLQHWTHISDKVLRCLSFTMGENLEELDLSFSHVRAVMLEILLARASKLRVLKFTACPFLDGQCMSLIARMSQKTVIELYVDKCQTFTYEPLLLLAGCLGFNPPRLSRLRAIDFGECPIEDRGLVAVASCCKQLRFLNLSECENLSDEGVVAIARAPNKNLQLLNLSGVVKITNKSLAAIASCCPDLISINVSRCPNISNQGALKLARKCPKLQAANFAGLLHIDEEALCAFVNNCPGLLMLNVTGCEKVTMNGLTALVQGVPKVELGISFTGFRPVDSHVEKKLSGHLDMLRDTALELIKSEKKAIQKKAEMEAKALEDKRMKSAFFLQQYMYRYKCRMHFYRLWKFRCASEAATTIQRIWRGIWGRARSAVRAAYRRHFLANAPAALKIQKTVRGHFARIHNPRVARMIRDLYSTRRKEAEAAIAVRFQACGRRFLARRRMQAFKEVLLRRRLDEENAIAILQLLARGYLAKRFVKFTRFEKARREDLENRTTIKIQRWYRKQVHRYMSKLSGAELLAAQKGSWRASMFLQRVYRGYRARERVNKMRIISATRNYAAIAIQKTFRAARILYWKDMRLNVIAAYALDRQYIERRERVAASRFRYRSFVLENRRDSASDSEDFQEEFDKVWVKYYDEKKKKDYWYCEVANEITFEEPKVMWAHEKNFIGMRIRVYWIVQGGWYEATVTDFHRRKRRHRIDYDDGDHEWINMELEHERVQVQLPDGSWQMYLMYQSPGELAEWDKLETQKQNVIFKEQAWNDANCWKLIVDDQRAGPVIYISTRTGEIRAGVPGSTAWVVQDDGFGLPCFYNINTEEIEHEDPRFLKDTDADINAQRDYVMQEARYSLYFCEEFWKDWKKVFGNPEPEDPEDFVPQDRRGMHLLLLRIRISPKPKHLASFLIRAKALYKRVSVVDKVLNPDIDTELTYMQWISERMSELLEMSAPEVQTKKDKKKEILEEIYANAGDQYFCPKCGVETKKELDYCKNCGKRQIWQGKGKGKPAKGEPNYFKKKEGNAEEKSGEVGENGGEAGGEDKGGEADVVVLAPEDDPATASSSANA